MPPNHPLVSPFCTTSRKKWRAALVGACVALVLPLGVCAAVTIDQTPLTVQKPLAPNLVLMLDDSGSMNWDFMPDWGFLSNTTNDGVRDSDVNGTYYNPNVVYAPPPLATGGTYPNSGSISSNPMATAYFDGFNTSTTSFLCPTSNGGAGNTCDATNYTSPGDGSRGDNSTFPYFQQFTAALPTTYAPSPGCAAGDSIVTSGQNSDQCAHTQVTYTYYTAFLGLLCNLGDSPVVGTFPVQCQHPTSTTTYYAPSSNNPGCPSGGSYDPTQGLCVRPQNVTANVFTYTTTNASGTGPTYIHHYVGKTAQDCQAALAADTSQGVTCDYSLTTRQNVANWFSYYRTRINMAKSGLMAAFNTLPTDTRFGFGSINGNAVGAIPSPIYPFNDYTGSGTGLQNNKLAEVEPFGNGSAGTQKANFWNWIVSETANGRTPLPSALASVGQYYQTSQPWQNSDSDTTQLACRQSYTVMTTDGFWNGSTPSVGNVDGTAGPTNVSANGDKYTYPAQPPYSDSYSNTLADVAMYYWKNDLMPSLPNEVPTTPEDPAFWQHMTTFTLGLGFAPLYADQKTPIPMTQVFSWANGGTAIPGFAWPQPSSNSINNIADLAHAAVNGHGGFYSATSPLLFINGIAQALARVAERVGTGASLAANSTKLDTGTTTYQALYWTGAWKGDLRAFAVDPNTGAIATSPLWSAQQALPAWNARNVWTYNPIAGKYIQFDAANLSKLSTPQQNALAAAAAPQNNPAVTNPDCNGSGTTSACVIDYLLGDTSVDTSHTTGVYRQRDTALGDIVDSQPVYEGAPNPNLFMNQSFTGADSYAAFAGAQVSRQAVVWVAANDGMLHAFDASSGQELFAYLPASVITANIPGAVQTGISNLTDPHYGTSNPHEYFNDGQVTIGDAFIGGAWKSILVGTTGHGPAKAIYAFDVTNPAQPNFLWERSTGDGKSGSNYIGQIVGAPVIAQTAAGGWVAFVGNGYNSTTNQAALLQFDLSSGALTVYPAGNATNDGLAAPSVRIADAGSGLATTAYAGDLNGDVWAFDLTSPGSTGSVVFTATDSNGTAQPITGGVLMGIDPSTQNVWLFFGTGQYLTQSDLADTNVQTWYGIIVQSAVASSPAVSACSAAATQNNTCAPGNRSALVARTIAAEVAPNSSTNPPTLGGRVISTPAPNDMNGKSGWYIDLVSPTLGQQGERMVLTNQFQGSLLLGTTRIPVASDPCNPSGAGWVMAVNPFTGTNPAAPFFDLNGDRQFTDADEISYNGQLFASAGIGFTSVPNAPIFVGNTMLTSFDNATASSIATAGSVGAVGRVSWRELVNQ